MFLRALFWLVLLIAAWWIFRKRTRPAPPPLRPSDPPAPPAIAPPEPMVDCARCGLHLPASEALRDDAARAYCSAEHRAAGPRP
jgi:uncharacterized protein